MIYGDIKTKELFVALCLIINHLRYHLSSISFQTWHWWCNCSAAVSTFPQLFTLFRLLVSTLMVALSPQSLAKSFPLHPMTGGMFPGLECPLWIISQIYEMCSVAILFLTSVFPVALPTKTPNYHVCHCVIVSSYHRVFLFLCVFNPRILFPEIQPKLSSLLKEGYKVGRN